jgi:hypothetical protein
MNQDWDVRYLVVDAGNGKRLFVSPGSVHDGWGRAGVQVNLTRGDVADSSAGLDEAALRDANDSLDSVKKTAGFHIPRA